MKPPALPRVPGGRLPTGTSGHTSPRGPQPRGDRLLRRLREINALDGITITVGLQGRGGAAGEATDDELVQIGRAHEYGLGVPERPWLRTALAAHGKVWAGGLKVALKLRAGGDLEGSVVTLRQVGVVAVDDVQTTIATGPWKPNAPYTIKRKGSSKPLIDTTQMVQSIRATIEGPGLPEELIG